MNRLDHTHISANVWTVDCRWWNSSAKNNLPDPNVKFKWGTQQRSVSLCVRIWSAWPDSAMTLDGVCSMGLHSVSPEKNNDILQTCETFFYRSFNEVCSYAPNWQKGLCLWQDYGADKTTNLKRRWPSSVAHVCVISSQRVLLVWKRIMTVYQT